MAIFYPHISGVILAGGQSTRFGENKAYARFKGIPFIFHVLKTLKYLFPELLLVTNTPDEYRNLPVKVIQDDVAHQGPLGGIATALRCAEHDRIFVVACDMPLILPEDVHTVIAGSDGLDAVIPLHQGVPAFTMAVYSRSLLEPMQTSLKEGKLSLKDFLKDRPRIQWITLEGFSPCNVNTKEDLEHLEAKHAL